MRYRLNHKAVIIVKSGELTLRSYFMSENPITLSESHEHAESCLDRWASHLPDGYDSLSINITRI